MTGIFTKTFLKTPQVVYINPRGEGALPRRPTPCLQQVRKHSAQKQNLQTHKDLEKYLDQKEHPSRNRVVRINKAGSSSLLGLFIQLAMPNKFVVVSRGLPKVKVYLIQNTILLRIENEQIHCHEDCKRLPLLSNYE